MTRPAAAIVVTGSELVRGERPDLNGPFLARELLRLGVEPARIVVVGDGEAALEDALRDGLRAELCVVSGGLGPTHDDRTVATLARVAERPLAVDPALAEEIGAVSRGVAERLGRAFTEFEAGVRKQASVPEGAFSLGLAGTAPGLVLDRGDGAVVVLPGPPGELQRLWARALDAPPVRRVIERASPPARHVLRLFGVSESAVARALEEAGGDGDGVEATICARDFEIHVDVLGAPAARAAAEALADRLATILREHVYARDERPVEEHVLDLCRGRGLTLATAESCTGGLVAGRLTALAGASDVFLGSVVAYANAVKAGSLGVPEKLLERHGAVSAEAAAAMAAGVRKALGADVGVAVTGIAGPGGGTAEKPVGLVHLHAAGPGGGLARRLEWRGDRETIRSRAAVTALHLVRALLTQSRHEAV